MIEVEIIGVSDTPTHPVVLLRHEERVLPMVVGFPEAQAIQLGLNREKLGRPMTHDLICNLLVGLRADLQSVTIYKLENDTFFAHLNLEQLSTSGDTEQVLRVDTRPSDGIAIAVRKNCPIYVAEEVMERAAQDVGMTDPEDIEGPEDIPGDIDD